MILSKVSASLFGLGLLGKEISARAWTPSSNVGKAGSIVFDRYLHTRAKM